jgi:hypothetical protein
MTEEFEYDVAFSFNALDEGIATQLNDLLSPRLKTFIYSERQREIAGTDGQEASARSTGKRPDWLWCYFDPNGARRLGPASNVTRSRTGRSMTAGISQPLCRP